MTTASQDTQLAQALIHAGIREEDIEEKFVRSGGHGGQNVNKTATCVMLVHRPTGIQVKCQSTRQQGQNRLLARQLLVDKIIGLRRKQVEAERARLEKIRRQKRRRPHAVQERVLADKSHRAAKKAARRHQEMD